MIRAVIYARYSSDSQRDISIDDQFAAGQRFADENGMAIVGRYHDNAISGRSDDRSDLRRMMAEKDKYDVVVFWNTDRFHRNMFNSFRYLGELMEAGKDFASITQPELNGNSEVRMLLFSIYSWKDQKYSDDLAVNVTRGMRGKAERCQYLGYQTFGYGHEGDAITINEDEAYWVRRVFSDFIAGKTVKAIANDLADAGIRTSRGLKPSYNFVDGILRNERYYGVYMWKDVRIEGGMPAIVSKDTWDQAQGRVHRRTRCDRRYDYLLSGRLVCATCGEYMHGDSAKSGNALYYACKGKRRACRGNVSMDGLNSLVLSTVRRIFADYDTCEAVVRQYTEALKRVSGRTDVKAMQKQLVSVRKKRSNLVKAISEGLPMSDAAQLLSDLEAEEDGVLARIEEAEASSRPVTDEMLFEFLNMVREGEFDDCGILDAFVSAVYLYEDKVVIVTNIADAQTTLLEVEAALETNVPPDLSESTCNSRMVGPAGFEPATKGL